MENINLVDKRGTDVNDFVKAYRDSLGSQYNANVAQLQQEKRNQDAQIMSQANRAGMLYSNFPERTKIQTEPTYLENLSKAHNTYQSGLDKLRSNAVSVYNNIRSLEEAIADLNAS